MRIYDTVNDVYAWWCIKVYLYTKYIADSDTVNAWWCIKVYLYTLYIADSDTVTAWWCIKVYLYTKYIADSDTVYAWWCIKVYLYTKYIADSDTVSAWWCIKMYLYTINIADSDTVSAWWCIKVYQHPSNSIALHNLANLSYAERLNYLGAVSAEAQRLFYDLVFTFKLINGLIPFSLDDFGLSLSNNNLRGLRLNQEKILLESARRFYRYRIPALWNRLPENMRNTKSLSAFRNKLHIWIDHNDPLFMRQ